MDQFFTKKIYKAAFHLSGDKNFAVSLADDVSMSPDQVELISTLSAALCEKYKLLGQFAPEALLALTLCDYGIRVSLTMRKLDEIRATQGKPRPVAEAVAPSPKPPAPPAPKS